MKKIFMSILLGFMVAAPSLTAAEDSFEKDIIKSQRGMAKKFGTNLRNSSTPLSTSLLRKRSMY